MSSTTAIRTLAAFACALCGSAMLWGQERHYHGIGTETNSGADFALKITLDASGAPSIVGEFDATEYPGEATLCGKGDYTGTISGNSVSLNFVDEDDDPGCGSGGNVVSVSASLSSNGETLAGTYSINNVPRGTLTTSVAERWTGEGFNDPFSAPWIAELYIANVSPTVIAGELDATQAPGDQTICGRGIFVGSWIGNAIEFSFTSNDPDPGCGFDFGDVNTFNGTASSNGTVLSGTYVIDNGQDGTWSVIRETIFADGFEAGNTSQWSITVP